MIELKLGQYDIFDGDFSFKYVVHKIMKKTADVGSFTSYKGSSYNGRRFRRYPIDVLKQQINTKLPTLFKAANN